MCRLKRYFEMIIPRERQCILMSVSLFLILSSFSSGNNDLEETRNFSIDTVMIDTGDELLYLGEDLNALVHSDLSTDKSKLYILDYENVRLITIDLLNHKLENNIALDREGPDGVGDWISDLQVVNDTTLMVLGYNYFVIFKPNG